MSLLKKILHKLNGLHFPQEYLCFSKEKFRNPLYVYLCKGKQVIKDVSTEHLFIGYKPVIIALPFAAEEDIHLVFSSKTCTAMDSIREHDVLARLSLRKIESGIESDVPINYYECTNGTHRFINAFHQWVLALNNRLFSNKTGNIYLRGNLYKQVQIAYAVPRKICLVTTGKDNKYNLFPTDLHGGIDEHYIISLRKDGKACEQVIDTGRIVLSNIDAKYYKEVYALGKNHMRGLQPENNFAFTGKYSEINHLPLPAYATSYIELELVSSFSYGIHKILYFKIIKSHKLSEAGNTLAHIHNLYATWRNHNNIEAEYYFR